MAEHPPMTTKEFIKALLDPSREEELDSFRVIALMPIDPYDHVADIGCGPGYFAIPLAKHLINGKLFALDILDEMLDTLRDRVAEANLGNVEVIKCSQTEFSLPGNSLDGVFLAFVTHQNDDRAAFLEAAMRLLKPRGWCTILEWYRKETGGGPPLEKRIEPDELEALVKRVGFRFRWWRDLNGRQYMAMMRK